MDIMLALIAVLIGLGTLCLAMFAAISKHEIVALVLIIIGLAGLATAGLAFYNLFQ